ATVHSSGTRKIPPGFTGLQTHVPCCSAISAKRWVSAPHSFRKLASPQSIFILSFEWNNSHTKRARRSGRRISSARSTSKKPIAERKSIGGKANRGKLETVQDAMT